MRIPSPTRPTMEEVRAWRDRHSVTQDDLADLLGVTTTTVSAWETGRTQPPAYLELALAWLSGRMAAGGAE